MHIDEAALLKMERTIPVAFVNAASALVEVELSRGLGSGAVELVGPIPFERSMTSVVTELSRSASNSAGLVSLNWLAANGLLSHCAPNP